MYTEIWQEPARGGFADPAYLAYPGIDVLKALVERRIPRCPVERLTGRRLVECGPGLATTVMPASEWFAGPKGTVHSGALAFIADMPLLCAILSRLPARTLCTTAELSMTFLGAPARTGGVITARGHLIRTRREAARMSEPRTLLVVDDTPRNVKFLADLLGAKD